MTLKITTWLVIGITIIILSTTVNAQELFDFGNKDKNYFEKWYAAYQTFNSSGLVNYCANCTGGDCEGGTGSTMWIDGGTYIYPNSTFADDVIITNGYLGISHENLNLSSYSADGLQIGSNDTIQIVASESLIYGATNFFDEFYTLNTMTFDNYQNCEPLATEGDGSLYCYEEGTFTVTESQITDLSHTVDTNASTACSGNEVLRGDGTCNTTEGGTVTDVWVNETGDTMTGNLDMSDNNITDLRQVNFTDGIIEIKSKNTGTDYTISIGDEDTELISSGFGSIMIGPDVQANYQTIAVGWNAYCDSVSGVCLGHGVYTDSQSAIAIGNNAQADQSYAIAIGNSANVTIPDGDHSIAIGEDSFIDSFYSVCIGHSCTMSGSAGYGIGIGSYASGSRESVAIGKDASTIYQNNTAIGSGAFADGTGGHRGIIAIGRNASGTKEDSMALGSNSRATAIGAISIGANVENDQANTVKIGQTSVIVHYNEGNVTGTGNSSFLNYVVRDLTSCDILETDGNGLLTCGTGYNKTAWDDAYLYVTNDTFEPQINLQSCISSNFVNGYDGDGTFDCSQPDHGGLAGLSDDDHTQYVLDAGDEMTGTLNISTGNLTVSEDYFICLSQDCSKYIMFNGTTTIIEG